jgi:hypothetical protein
MKKNCLAKLAKKVVTKDGFERIQAILYIIVLLFWQLLVTLLSKLKKYDK